MHPVTATLDAVGTKWQSSSTDHPCLKIPNPSSPDPLKHPYRVVLCFNNILIFNLCTFHLYQFCLQIWLLPGYTWI